MGTFIEMNRPPRALARRMILGALFLSIAVPALLAEPSRRPVRRVVSPQPQQEAAQPIGASDAAAAGEAPANTTNVALDFLYNQKPADGTAAKDLSTLARVVGDKAMANDALGITLIADEATEARFEKFLGMAEVSPDQLAEYDQLFQETLGLLADFRIKDAWLQLDQLAKHSELDAGISRELANRISSIWDANRAGLHLARENESLKETLSVSNWNADLMAEGVRRRELDFQEQAGRRAPTLRLRNFGSSQDGGNAANNRRTQRPGTDNQSQSSSATDMNVMAPDLSGAMGKMRLSEQYMQSVEAKTRMKLNEVEMDQLETRNQNDFSAYIKSLFAAGRYRHVVLAADFYRRLFNKGEYPVDIADQVNAALEILQEVDNAVAVFDYNLGRSELVSATERLQEAFLVSSNHPSLLSIAREKKQQVQDFLMLIDRIRNMIEVRDFVSLEMVLDRIQKLSIDFDPTKPRAIVNAVQLESKMRLGQARLAAQNGDLAGALEQFQSAAEIWPGNPDLEGSANQFFEAQDFVNRTVEEFDRLYDSGDYRAIFGQQLAFAPALKNDEVRQGQFKQVIEAVSGAQMAVEKANALRGNGDHFGAWETVELAIEAYPDDVKLNALRGELAGRGAEFVAAINKAREAEKRQDWGYSLSWFAIAQRHYPPSDIANESIDRLSKKVLDANSF